MAIEIKFRAWDKFAKIMRDDGTAPTGPHMKYDVGIMPKHAYNHWASGIDGLEIRVDSTSFDLMQFTGLKDKNGKEIYEGDIIKFQVFANWDDDTAMERHTATVIFDEGAFMWKIFKQGCNSGYYSANGIDVLRKINSTWGLEIIGNIYENPELISDKVS